MDRKRAGAARKLRSLFALAVLLLMMSIALFNDITRLFG